MKDLGSKNISVLLVDDDEDDYVIIKRVFSKIPESPFTLTWCSTYDEAVPLVKNSSFDIYLIDYRLGAHTGLELLEIAEPHKRSEPFILLTGAGDTNIEQKSMRLAAADYLTKSSLRPDTLSRALYYAMGRKQIESQRLQHFIELNKTKDEFISLASHQLRTPATGVKQYLGMVLEGMSGELNDFQRELLQKAYESNERQLTIVSDLLKVAQVDAGKVKLKLDVVDLVAMVKDIVKEQAGTFKQRSQKVKVESENASISAVIDSGRLRMVLENMLDNASKYSEENTTISIMIAEADASIKVSIKDQGVGIKPEDQARLFEKFNRIYNYLSDHVEGTGLGLYWAKKVVDLHGGTIQLESEEGKGSIFTVSLPKPADNTMLEHELTRGAKK